MNACLRLLPLAGAVLLGACATPRTDPQAFQAGVAAYDAGDYEKAHEIWVPLAERGDLAAQRNVAHLKRRGLGVTPDPEGALDLYREAAERGLVSAQVNLALLYLEGEGTERDARKAAHWFERAARSGSAEAQYQIGRMLEEGDGLKRNRTKAAAFYLAAAGQGHAPARARLGRMKMIVDGITGLEPVVRPDTAGGPARGPGPLYGGTRDLPSSMP